MQIAAKDRHKTVIITEFNTFKHFRVALCLMNSLKFFQSMMRDLLLYIVDLNVCVDDAIIATETVYELFIRLQKVLDIFLEKRVNFKPDKCNYLNNEVRFLSDIVSEIGISVD